MGEFVGSEDQDNIHKEQCNVVTKVRQRLSRASNDERAVKG